MNKRVEKALRKQAGWRAGLTIGLPTALASYAIAKKLGANEYLAGGIGLGVGGAAGYGSHKLYEKLLKALRTKRAEQQYKEFRSAAGLGPRPQDLYNMDKVDRLTSTIPMSMQDRKDWRETANYLAGLNPDSDRVGPTSTKAFLGLPYNE